MGGKTSTSFSSTNQADNHTPQAEKKRAETRHYNKLIKGEIYNEIRKALTDPEYNGKGKPFYQEFIAKATKDGLKDPNSPIGRMLAEELFREDIITLLDAQTEKYLDKDIDLYQFRLQKRLFNKQKDVFNDFISRRKCSMCSRRAGKTEENVDEMLKIAAIPNSPILYINLTFDNAIKQTFDKVVQEAERVDLMIQSKSKSEGYITFTNGSTILFKGNKDRSEADKLQGFKYRLVIIDEAQSQCNMIYLIETIIEPMLTDFADSVLYLTGTPPRRKGTYFEYAFNNPAWTSYHWTMKDNPYIPDVDTEIQRVCTEKGVDKDSPFIKREYFGEMAYDTEAQVFKGYQTYSGEVPAEFVPDHLYGGNDFGFADYNGIIQLVGNVAEKKAFVVFERKFNKSTVSNIIDVTREGFEEGKKFLMKRNRDADLSNVGIYTDSNEKSITYEMNTTYGLPAYCAYKYNKAMAVEQLAEWMRTGRIVIPEGGAIADECDQILYKRDELDNITSEIDDAYHPDIIMALLYAFRQFLFDCGEDLGGESENKKTGDY